VFNLKKVKRARKRIGLITEVLFKLFQFSLRYKERRKEYGIEIFEYFYLPWRTNKEFNNSYNKIKNFTLNPKSRLYTIYELSQYYLKENTTFIEVGTWRGGICGLISLTNKDKKFDLYACDSFEGVKNSSDHDSFFEDGEYSDASINDIKEVEEISNHEIKIIEGIFPESMLREIEKPISFAHIDVDTYVSAKESFEYISGRLLTGGVVVLDDYGGWFTDGVTRYGNELKDDTNFFVVPNHLGQLIIFKK
jgi:O-methyltransferase|tara:strand:- start:915 stop:1664 length:750 start_codon:yes stop_codon:yes gene_type:complete